MKKKITLLIEFALSPLTLLSAFWFRFIRRSVLTFHKKNSVVTEQILDYVGVIPILDHF